MSEKEALEKSVKALTKIIKPPPKKEEKRVPAKRA